MGEQKMIRRACELPENMTFPERKLWYALRDRRLNGIKIRRQCPIVGDVVDFVSFEHSLVIELDANSHIGRFENDRRRQAGLELEGYRILRIANDDVLRDLDSVLLAILKACGC